MIAYIYKNKHRTGGYLLVIKSNGQIISQRTYRSIESAKDEAKLCQPGNY